MQPYSWKENGNGTPFTASSKCGFSRSLFWTSSSDTDCILTFSLVMSVPTLRWFCHFHWDAMHFLFPGRLYGTIYQLSFVSLTLILCSADDSNLICLNLLLTNILLHHFFAFNCIMVHYKFPLLLLLSSTMWCAMILDMCCVMSECRCRVVLSWSQNRVCSV